jgi:NAD(P)-dependent dehydrogenase (short-subunit alcohol dehydrogenase family)
MNLELIDKTAFICGSTKGIGLAIPSQLAAEGARVIVNVRSASAIHSDWEQVRKVVPEVKVDGFAGISATTTALKPCGSFSRGGLSGRKFSARGFLR